MKRLTMISRSVMIVAVLFVLFPGFSPLDASTDNASPFNPIPLADSTKKSYTGVQDYTAIFLKQERFGHKMGDLEEIEFKFRKPNDVYMKWIGDANKGQEALYRLGQNNNKVKAHKGGLLNVININSAPEGALLMQGNHHRILDAGIGPTSALVHRGMHQGIDRKEATFINHGIEKVNGRDAIKIEALYPESCEGVSHTVVRGETLWDIAKKYNQDMYVILHNNDKVDNPTDVRTGQKILVPYHYCRRAITWTDKELNLLTKLEIYDWNNKLYEYYEFKDVKLNVGLTDKDFDPDNPQYKF